MVNEDDVSEKAGDTGFSRPYWDPALVNSRRKARQFVPFFFLQRQLLRFTIRPLDHVGGLIRVEKKKADVLRFDSWQTRGCRLGNLDLHPMSLCIRPKLSHVSKSNTQKAPFHNLLKDGGY